MTDCCDGCTTEALRTRQRGTLHAVLWINAVMFIVILAAAFHGKSSALLSDSLDNLGDALTYALSLFAVSRSPLAKARVALFKGGLISAAALMVIGRIVHSILHPALPSYEVMGIFSIAGLAANGTCLFLLWRHRDEDINMSSVFECSRNDIIANSSVIVAAVGVSIFGSGWPDLVVASILAGVLLHSSARVIRAAALELRRPALG